MTRKPGEPIYLKGQMVALCLAVLASLVLPRLYELLVGPLSFAVRLLSGLLIAVVSGIILFRVYQPSARNEP